MSTENKLALIDAKELSFVDENSLSPTQLKHILKRTPKNYIKQRPAKGGGTWSYVTGGYVKKCLNLMFGWDWDFEIIDERIELEAKEVIVKGRLTCRSNGRTIVKMQYGNKDIIFRKGTTTPLSIGNDMKSAATDALKKCASEIGIAADIYNAEDFKEVAVAVEKTDLEILTDLFKKNAHQLEFEDAERIQEIIDTKEQASYTKVINQLKSL